MALAVGTRSGVGKPKTMQVFCPQRPSPGTSGAGNRCWPGGHTICRRWTLAEAIETTRIHSVGRPQPGPYGVVTTARVARPIIPSDAGLIGGGHMRCRVRCRWPITACSFWMSSRVPPPCPGGVAATVGGWRGDDCAGLSVGNVTHASVMVRAAHNALADSTHVYYDAYIADLTHLAALSTWVWSQPEHYEPL